MARLTDKIVKAYPNGFLVYTPTGQKGERTEAQKKTEENLSRGQYNGYMSKKTSKKVHNLINNLHDAQAYLKYNPKTQRGVRKAKVNFVTLTLPSPQVHDDNYIKRHCLNRLLTQLKDRGKLTAFIWRAEPQKNGNIHFHLLTPDYIHWKELRDLWNSILSDHGYIQSYREIQKQWHKGGFKVRKNLLKNWTFNAQKKAYSEGVKSNWSNPNTTDIHATKHIKNIASYITKYMCKHGENGQRKINGRIWGCSDNLRNTKVCTFASHFEFEVFEQLCKENAEVSTYEEEFYTSYYFKEEGLFNYPRIARMIFQANCVENYHIIFKS